MSIFWRECFLYLVSYLLLYLASPGWPLQDSVVSLDYFWLNSHLGLTPEVWWSSRPQPFSVPFAGPYPSCVSSRTAPAGAATEASRSRSSACGSAAEEKDLEGASGKISMENIDDINIFLKRRVWVPFTGRAPRSLTSHCEGVTVTRWMKEQTAWVSADPPPLHSYTRRETGQWVNPPKVTSNHSRKLNTSSPSFLRNSGTRRRHLKVKTKTRVS